jgi:ribA/ribD-fused uncharacterized protein
MQMDRIDHFDGDWHFLTNFSASPIVWEGREWPTVEHLFQAHKSLDDEERELIRTAHTPAEAKRLGRRVTKRSDWEEVRQDVMLQCLRAKFSQNSDLAQRLLDTRDALLVEGNTWHDNTWGDCRCKRCAAIEGDNLLGKALMQIRNELRATIDSPPHTPCWQPLPADVPISTRLIGTHDAGSTGILGHPGANRPFCKKRAIRKSGLACLQRRETSIFYNSHPARPGSMQWQRGLAGCTDARVLGEEPGKVHTPWNHACMRCVLLPTSPPVAPRRVGLRWLNSVVGALWG